MTPAIFELALPATKLLQTYALDRATNGIGNCGVISLKLTGCVGKFDSEMNIAIKQRKAMCVHIHRVQSPYFCFVIKLCSVTSFHSAGLKVSHWDSVRAVCLSESVLSSFDLYNGLPSAVSILFDSYIEIIHKRLSRQVDILSTHSVISPHGTSLPTHCCRCVTCEIGT